MPNAYTALVIREQKRRGWTNVQLADKADLSKQVVGDVVNDTRELLKQRPDPKTVRGFADAFEVPELVVWQEVVKAMGIPVASEASLVVELQEASNEALLRELAQRLEGGTEHGERSAEKSPDDGGGEVLTFPQPQEVPDIPEDLASNDTGKKSQYERATEEQERGYKIDQSDPEPD